MKAGIRAAVVTFGLKIKQPHSQVHSRYPNLNPNQRGKLGTERVQGERPGHLSASKCIACVASVSLWFRS